MKLIKLGSITAAIVISVGCSMSPLQPSTTIEMVSGQSIMTGQQTNNACILSTLPQALQDPNILSGTLAGSTLTVRDQFGETVVWSGSIAGSRYHLAAIFADPYSGACSMTEHVLGATLDLQRNGNVLIGVQVNRYALKETGEPVTDTLAWSITVR